MPRRPHTSLSDAEVESLTRLARGNALAKRGPAYAAGWHEDARAAELAELYRYQLACAHAG
ncbi:hypothetical protein HOP52_12580 [Halomonas campisalis]|uniref:Uncharacterized protein n=1 Tax=Billgrantia campisalis TaxID=74661 RepID=A0ABS9PA04_9GAMM|nr:hypothetical protein [Halomonas campisalis]MCG6658588.1 hypothetical protein [Halomonas campisalis]MDR5863450.1 hypothetical protein [Halomonas campisalis]